MRKKYSISIALILSSIVLSACGEKINIQSQFCRMAIEDVFLPAHKLQILSVQQSKKENETESSVEYAITDATGKRVTDTAICTFDDDPESTEIKTLTQFNNQMPQSHIQFLNRRVSAKFAALTNPNNQAKAPAEAEKPVIDLSAPPPDSDTPPAPAVDTDTEKK